MPEKRILRAPSFFSWQSSVTCGGSDEGRRNQKRAFELDRRAITQSRVQALAVVDFFDEPLDGGAASAKSRYSCRYTSSYFSVFMNDSHVGVVVRISAAAHADPDAVFLEHACSRSRRIERRDRNDGSVPSGRVRRRNAIFSAAIARSSSRLRSSAHPITRREKASSTTAR